MTVLTPLLMPRVTPSRDGEPEPSYLNVRSLVSMMNSKIIRST